MFGAKTRRIKELEEEVSRLKNVEYEEEIARLKNIIKLFEVEYEEEKRQKMMWNKLLIKERAERDKVKHQ